MFSLLMQIMWHQMSLTKVFSESRSFSRTIGEMSLLYTKPM
jgi:hypothetical protein